MDYIDIINSHRSQSYYYDIQKAVNYCHTNHMLCPPRLEIYRALSLVESIEKTKVVIIGQDPYPGEGQANGLAFAVDESIAIPPSLGNIFKEIKDEFGAEPKDRTLKTWAKQGVLLLNTILTTQMGKMLAHKDIGWQQITSDIVHKCSEDNNPKVFLLWGKYAQFLNTGITNPIHLVINTSHPSPLSAKNGFFGSNCFKQCNEFLVSKGLEPIKWV